MSDPNPDIIFLEDETLRGGFTQIPNALLGRTDLSSGAKLTYVGLLSFAWQKGSCFPGQEKLAEHLGLGKRSVIRHLKELQQANILRIHRRGLGKTNVYTLAKVRTQKDEDIVRQKCQNGTSGNAKLTLQKMPHWHTKEYTEEKHKAHEINVNGNFLIQKPKLGNGPASLRDILTQYGIDGASREEITPKPKLKSEHYAKRDYVATELAHDFADSKSLGCYRTIAEKVPEHVIFEVRSAVLDAYRNGTIRESRGALFVGIIQEYCVRHGIALGFQDESTGAYSPDAISP